MTKSNDPYNEVLKVFKPRGRRLVFLVWEAECVGLSSDSKNDIFEQPTLKDIEKRLTSGLCSFFHTLANSANGVPPRQLVFDNKTKIEKLSALFFERFPVKKEHQQEADQLFIAEVNALADVRTPINLQRPGGGLIAFNALGQLYIEGFRERPLSTLSPFPQKFII